MKRLQHLEISNLSVSDDDLKQLEQLSKLKVLYIHSDKMSGTGLASLNKLKNLTEIRIGSDSFEFVRLNDMPKLAMANFIGGDFRDIVVKNCPALDNLSIKVRSHRGKKPPSLHLENLPKLEHLSFQVVSALTLKQLGALTYLQLNGHKLDTLKIDGLPRVTDIGIYGATLPSDAFHQMSELPALDHVDLNRITFRVGSDGVRGLRADDLTALNRHKKITSLAIRGKLIDPTVVAGIKNFPNLTDLVFSGCGIRDDHLRLIRVSSQLRTLALNSNPINGESLKDLSLDKLERLSLSDCRLSDKGMENIGRISTLVFLDISQAKVKSEQLRHLSHLFKLQSIFLRYNEINDEGLNHIICLPELKWYRIDLRGTKVSREKRRQLNGPPTMMTQPTPPAFQPIR